MQRQLTIEPSVFAEHFPQRPFRIHHQLADHPLFQLPRLIELSRVLPPELVEYNAGNVAIGQDPANTPRTGLAIEETIRRIEEANSWMVLKYVERDPAYRQLLIDCLDEVRPLSDRITPGMCNIEGFIFVTSPNSTTPYHMDPEHNFLLQVRGRKIIHMWDQDDRTILSEEQLESFYVGGIHRNMPYKEEFTAREMRFELEPGDGLHFPITAPHWVKVEGNFSISFSVTFRSNWSDRRSRLYQMNAALRRKGLHPSPISNSGFRDASKDIAFRVLRKARALVSRGPERSKPY